MLRRLRRLVERRIVLRHFGGAAAIEQTQGQRRRGREQHVVQTDGPAFEDDLTGPGRVEGEPQLHDVEGDVLVERVEDEATHAVVIGRAVHQQQPSQEAKLPCSEEEEEENNKNQAMKYICEVS